VKKRESSKNDPSFLDGGGLFLGRGKHRAGVSPAPTFLGLRNEVD
jgi:hypothetical protein